MRAIKIMPCLDMQKGWGEISGPPGVRQQILDALAEVRSQAVVIHEDEPEG